MLEGSLVLLVTLLVLAVPIAVLVLSIIAFVRSRRIADLGKRVERLEARVAGKPAAPPAPEPLEAPREAEVAIVAADAVELAEQAGTPQPVPAALPRRRVQWELLIGQKVLGWTAVVLLVFTAAFFLKYAYDNDWVGPLGRVMVGGLAGSALMIAGLRYHGRGLRIFSQMLSAAGIVVLFLSTYGAFGFYQLLPQHHAGVFLAIIVILSMITALLYDSLAIALMAVLGGLLTPLLISPERDAYVAFFTYLTVLNGGVVFLMLRRGWPAFGSIALVGTHLLFWYWYEGNYHPEKQPWALGFQSVVFLLYLSQHVGVQFFRCPENRWESAGRMLANAALWFGAFFVLLEDDYRGWMGSAAIVMAIAYALFARLLLAGRDVRTLEVVTAVALTVGFVGLAFPLEADARWVGLGWAATATALWWFGLRVQTPPLRALAALIAGAAVLRLLFVDLPSYSRLITIPVFNRIALPAVGVAACVLGSVIAARSYRDRLGTLQRFLVAASGLAGVVLLWFVLSVDLLHYFDARGRVGGTELVQWRRMGQMSLSLFWAVYATAVLAVGFRLQLARLRWLAIGFYALTVGKVLLVDMASLGEGYRIVAFFVLALLLGISARLYQRVRWASDAPGSLERTSHDER